MSIPRSSIRNRQRGVVSLLALILMAAITSIAASSSIIAIVELRQSETISQSFVAAYAAESGMENGLYTVKVNRPTASVAETEALLNTLKDTQTGKYIEQPVRVGSSATWHRSAIPSLKRIQIARLAPDQSAVLDYYNPDNFATSLNQDCNGTNPPCATTLYVTWEDNCNGFSWMEVTATDLSSLFDPLLSRSSVAKVKQPCNCTGAECESSDLTGHQVCTAMEVSTFSFLGENGVETPIDMFLGNPMRFTFRPIPPLSAEQTDVACTIENLTAEIHDDNWKNWVFQPESEIVAFLDRHTKSIPAHLTITATGSFGKTKQALTATVPWKAPVSGLLNFVLFSEFGIEK